MLSMQPLRVGFVISDTGGGHRASAQAIAAGLEHRYPGKFKPLYIDVFRSYAPFPWRYAPEIYPVWVNWSAFTYGFLFFLCTDYLLRLPLPGAKHGFALRTGKRMLTRMLADHRPDVLVLIHPIPVRPLAGARTALGIEVPMVSVVTDIGRPHIAWFHPDLDLCLVASRQGEALGRKAGLSPDKLRLMGPLAHPKFALYRASKAEAREELGWDRKLPVVLILGGGEGMGRLEHIARAIDRRVPKVQLAIVCGRNEKLRRKLSRVPWRSLVHLYGFVDHLEVLMRGADVLVSKAGPLTIAEAALSGLPMILYGAIPFQETRNVDFVVQGGAGVYLSSPRRIADTLARWLHGDGALAQYAAAARRLASPDPTFLAADEIAQLCGLRPRVHAQGVSPSG